MEDLGILFFKESCYNTSAFAETSQKEDLPMNNSDHIYSNLDLKKLLIPIIVEQLLSCLMGTVDTMMVSNVGSAAISADI